MSPGKNEPCSKKEGPIIFCFQSMRKRTYVRKDIDTQIDTILLTYRSYVPSLYICKLLVPYVRT